MRCCSFKRSLMDLNSGVTPLIPSRELCSFVIHDGGLNPASTGLAYMGTRYALLRSMLIFCTIRSLEMVPLDSIVVVVVSSTPRVPSMFLTTRNMCDLRSGRIGTSKSTPRCVICAESFLGATLGQMVRLSAGNWRTIESLERAALFLAARVHSARNRRSISLIHLS